MLQQQRNTSLNPFIVGTGKHRNGEKWDSPPSNDEISQQSNHNGIFLKGIKGKFETTPFSKISNPWSVNKIEI